MKLGYTIIYVPSVKESLQFFGQAFELEQKFLHESGDYGELRTGVHASDSKQPLGMEIALVTEDVRQAHCSALEHGATELSAPATKP